MKWIIVITAVLCAAYAQDLEDVDSFTPQKLNQLKDNGALKKFVEIVEQKKLNVTVAASQIKYTDKYERVYAVALSFPVNSELVLKKDSKLSKDVSEEFLKVATKNKVPASVSTLNVNNNKILKDHINHNHGLSAWSEVYDVVTNTENGLKNLLFDATNYEVNYNLLVPGADGKNETYKLYAQNFDVTAEYNNFSPEEKVLAEQIVEQLVLDVEDSEVAVKIISQVFDHELSGNWNVILNPGNYYIEGIKKSAVFNILDNKYLIYA